MTQSIQPKPLHPARRSLLSGALIAVGLMLLPAWRQKQVYNGEVRVDPGCGCCHAWLAQMRESGRFNLKLVEDANMPAFKDGAGIPAGLRSCHTALIEGIAIEGHTPVADVLRVLEIRPAGVVGLAVPGMPRGSPGMEMPNGARDAFEVVSFTKAGQRQTFSKYAAKG